MPTQNESEYLEVSMHDSAYPAKTWQPQQQQVIKKEMDALTAAEQVQHGAELEKARASELGKLFDLKCFERKPKSSAGNLVDTRWIYRWKKIDSKKQIKARITLRGFMDKADTASFAGTASKAAQRIVNSASTWHSSYQLASVDVSSAFARGLTFSQLQELGDSPREIEKEVSLGDANLVRKQSGFENFNERTECLNLLKPVYGLRDAPRAWERRLRKILTEEASMRSCSLEPRLYYMHVRDITEPDLRKRMEARLRPNGISLPILVVSTHVDDLKLAGPQEMVEWLVRKLSGPLGKLK
eukprot:113295-Amphidinium_carterae.1